MAGETPLSRFPLTFCSHCGFRSHVRLTFCSFFWAQSKAQRSPAGLGRNCIWDLPVPIFNSLKRQMPFDTLCVSPVLCYKMMDISMDIGSPRVFVLFCSFPSRLFGQAGRRNPGRCTKVCSIRTSSPGSALGSSRTRREQLHSHSWSLYILSLS